MVLVIIDIFMFVFSFIMMEGKIVEWLKQFGDKVVWGELVFVVEFDKVDMDVEFFQDGYFVVVLMFVGSMVLVGEIIGLIVEIEVEIVDVQVNVFSVFVVVFVFVLVLVFMLVVVQVLVLILVLVFVVVFVLLVLVVNDGCIVVSFWVKKLVFQMGVDLVIVCGSGFYGWIQVEDVE